MGKANEPDVNPRPVELFLGEGAQLISGFSPIESE